jgi:type VI secretion system protein ImpK
VSEITDPRSDAADRRRQAHALLASARPLVALATQLRRAVLDSPEAMKRALVAGVERFERELAAGGWSERSIVAASYVLCVWVDEVVADTPWGEGWTPLLERFHGERDSGARVVRLLSLLVEKPQENQALLELFHVCLSLGMTAGLRGTPDAVQQLEQLRARLYRALAQDDMAVLSPPWHAAVRPSRPLWQRHAWLGTLLLLGLAALAVYSTAHLRLASQVDAVFASMQRMATQVPAVRPPASPPPKAAVTPRLAPLLAPDIAAARLAVRDEEHRSVVSVPAERIFEADSTRLSGEGAALLKRVGAALAGQTGKVVVTGHTDGRDPRTARMPSAWHQSFEWAREVGLALGGTLPAQRLAVEGAADFDDAIAGAAALPPRRVDIVLFP